MRTADIAMKMIGVDLQAGRRVVMERATGLAADDRFANQIGKQNFGLDFFLVLFDESW